MSKQTQVLVAKTHVLDMHAREKSMLQRCCTHGHSLSKQTQVLVAKTHVMGMREVYASKVLDAWSQIVQANTSTPGKDPSHGLEGLREERLCIIGVWHGEVRVAKDTVVGAERLVYIKLGRTGVALWQFLFFLQVQKVTK